MLQQEQKKSWKVDISYDPRNMNNIYIHTKDEQIFETCYLLKHQERYQNKTLEEIKQLHMLESKSFKKEEHTLLQREINLFDSIQSIVDEAIKEVNQKQTKNLSKAEKLKDINQNTKLERKVRRAEEVFKLEDDDKNASIEDTLKEQKEEKLERKSVKELFNKRRRKES